MNLEINDDEKQQLLHCMDQAVKSAANSLQAALLLLPLAQKISDLKEEAVKDGNADC